MSASLPTMDELESAATWCLHPPQFLQACVVSRLRSQSTKASTSRASLLILMRQRGSGRPRLCLSQCGATPTTHNPRRGFTRLPFQRRTMGWAWALDWA